MADRVPSTFMLVPGPWRRIGELTKALAARGVVVQTEDDGPLKSGQARITLVEDEQLGKAFSWGRGGPLDATLVAQIASCERPRWSNSRGACASRRQSLRDSAARCGMSAG